MTIESALPTTLVEMTAVAPRRALPSDRPPETIFRPPEPPGRNPDRLPGVAGLRAYIDRVIAVERLALARFAVEHLELRMSERGEAARTGRDERRHPALRLADAHVAEARATYELVAVTARG